MSDFFKQLMQGMRQHYRNQHRDNFDFEIRPHNSPYAVKAEERSALEEELAELLNSGQSALIFPSIHGGDYFLEHIEAFEPMYEMLGDTQSRKRYIEVLLYKILGFTKVKLSLNTPEFWEQRAEIARCKGDLTIEANFRESCLHLYDLRSIGFDVSMFLFQNGIFVDFVLEQYRYQDHVCVEKGDIVIDGGGCWGDTALYFAEKGAGSVYVFEFIPSNVAILRQNLNLNPQHDSAIHIIEHPLWERSDLPLSYRDKGPASQVGAEGEFADVIETLSIDDLYRREALEHVDFIKMDIEGAELSALKGAAKTIRTHKPKLAISVYHKYDDMIEIPRYLHSLCPEYRFYFDYYTIIGTEFVLYAVCPG
ncbi:FkbM family methyltransferase [Candidatus Thiodiazotropha sp. CDECU1]|uniref:FkbM family methyltransferase n=1 Tax=Candidatus Thiodiazotropha sp. CDECU1 TaxID=3065865 RepID=UPI00293040B4|nr:FkbM family methyltransferase [Candidatus Thiodiazotropha sp. CDECU1]